MGLLDIAFLPSRASISPITFINKCGRGGGLRTATCLNTGWGNQGHAP